MLRVRIFFTLATASLRRALHRPTRDGGFFETSESVSLNASRRIATMAQVRIYPAPAASRIKGLVVARIALCQDVATEYMAFMYISAVLKKEGHTVDVFLETLSQDRLVEEVKAFQPDLIGFSVLTPARNWTLHLAQRLKEATGALTILGNVEAMLDPDLVEEPAVDIVCLSEGEQPMAKLAACLDEGRDYSHIEGLWVTTPEGIVKNPMPAKLADVDELPFHDRAMYDKYPFFKYSRYLRILNGRGCPFKCSFCLNPVISDHLGRKQYVRKRTPELAIQEIEYQVRSRPGKVDYIFIADEVLWLSKPWLREFLTLYRDRVGLPFVGNFRHGPIDEQDIALMKEAGADSIILAVETADEKQRQGLMKKNVSNASLLEAARLLHKYDIKILTSCFFGIPGDTVEELVKRLPFYREIGPAYLWTTFFAPYPHLELTATPLVQAHLPDGKEFSPTLHHDMYLELPDRARLIRLKKVYYLCMRFPWLASPLVWLTKFPLPLVFDGLFSMHFFWYALKFERVSVKQLMEHMKIFALKPLLRRGKS